MIFNKYCLKDITDKIGDGIHGTPEYDETGDYYFVNGNNLIDGDIVFKNDTKRINKEQYLKNKRDLNRNTLLVSINGTLGNVAKYNNEKIILGKSVCYINIKNNYNVDYVYFVFKSSTFKRYLQYGANGTTIKNVPLSAIRNYEISIPSKRNQDKIVKILKNIEDKIKLNNKINNNLHEYAQELFKEWFIKFNYPTSNKKKKNSELGLIPDDWKVGYFGDNILSKIIKSGVTKFNDEKKYVATADVSNSSINSFTMVKYEDKPSRANMTPIANSIWFAKMEGSKKNILVTNYTRELLNNYIFSTGFMGIECINNSINYLWELINSDSFVLEKDALSTGTLMAGISNSTITNYKYLIPTDEVLNKFNKIINVINNKIYNNQIQNKRLKQLRDTLLPKLMDGEIDLDNIEI